MLAVASRLVLVWRFANALCNLRLKVEPVLHGHGHSLAGAWHLWLRIPVHFKCQERRLLRLMVGTGNSKKGSVIIVGGGIAGLAAARELGRVGLPVTLVEAAERLGGRIHTVHQGSLPIELGAEFIHGRSELLVRALKAARLATSVVPGSSHLARNGGLARIDFWQDVEELIGRIPADGPDCSFAAFLARARIRPPLSDWARGFVEGFNAADAARISAQSVLKAQRSAERMDGDWQGRVRRGYGALIGFLEREASAAGVTLVRGAAVRQMDWAPGRVEVHWRSGGRAGTERAAAAVITLPLGVWQARAVSFRPPLRDKAAVARELLLGQVRKLTLVFRERWWPRSGSGFVHAPGERVPTWWGDPRGAALTGWAGGPKAEELMPLTVKQMERVYLETLARIFSVRISSLRRRLVAAHSYNWSADPNFGGAYSYLPVNGLDLPALLAAPVAETLFFAGEATTLDAQMGTVFGAYETGLRAAGEVLRSYRRH